MVWDHHPLNQNWVFVVLVERAAWEGSHIHVLPLPLPLRLPLPLPRPLRPQLPASCACLLACPCCHTYSCPAAAISCLS